MKYFLYILQSISSDKFYTGISKEPSLRLIYHNNLEKGFTARYRPWNIVFTKEFPSKEDAAFAERKIKKWKSKIMIRKVINREIQI
ncbi:MAG: excinuclease ABC subunit C [Ignavibacteriales bacterium CG18_big_fil_WC_8_21_14_2_50_31_20]|nr:MAG: excinuclease ABC subunit C [Ignavibacteriales bacterium CG18_big_fil_WC_8_21_14_2_50_31_20]